MKKIIHILFLMLLLLACSDEDSGSLGSSEVSGTQSGSYANMLVISGFLYVVSDSEIITYNISDPTVPVEIDRKELGFGVESLLHRSGILFIGSQEAMFIYQINPQGIPIALSRTDYGVSFNLTPCDPIVANDTMAVASLSSRLEGICTAININELRFYNIENLEDPVLFKHMEMEEPKGMALVDNLLFVCEAENGLKVLDVSDSNNYQIIYHYPGIRTFDVIPTGDILLVVGPESLFEFNYSDAQNIYFIGQFDF